MKNKDLFLQETSKTKSKSGLHRLFTVATTTYFLLSAFDTRLKVQRYIHCSSKVTKPIRLALLTDLHSCSYGEGQKQLLEAVHKENPDVVLFGGDIFDDILPFEQAEMLIAGLSQPYPCYYVTGNHEYWSDDLGLILRNIASYGVTILAGTQDILEVNENEINICGITDPELHRISTSFPSTTEQLESLSKLEKNDNLSILLAHRPEYIDFYLDYHYDVMLTGHSHGGQWRIPGVLNGLYCPQQGFFPKYAGGKYKFGEKSFIVSRGLSRENNKVPRIYNRPELVIVDILPQ